MKLAFFITLTPSFHQFLFSIGFYDDATQVSKSVSDSSTLGPHDWSFKEPYVQLIIWSFHPRNWESALYKDIIPTY